MTKKIAILVVGMHRSGTSALARTISLLGARLPRDLVGPNEGNPHGHWEPQLIVDLNDEMLADAGSDVYSIAEFDKTWFDSPRVTAFVAKAVEILKISFEHDPLIVIKDPRVALLLPIWHRALAELDYRCVHILPLRHPEAVADSLRRRHLKSISYDAWQDPRGQAVWLRYTLAAVISTRGLSRCFVNYADLLSDWRAASRLVTEKGDFVWPRSSATAEAEIDAFLHANRLAEPDRTVSLTTTQAPTELRLKELADALYGSLIQSGDDETVIDAIATAYRERMRINADVIGAYEILYPTIWQFYEKQLDVSKANARASERIAGMSDAVQNLWSDLRRASFEITTVNQNLGSQTSRVQSLEAALDHHGRMLAESNEHRDRYFHELGATKHHLDVTRNELAMTRNELAAATAQAEAARADIQALFRSSSWRLTGPMRRVIRWMRR